MKTSSNPLGRVSDWVEDQYRALPYPDLPGRRYDDQANRYDLDRERRKLNEARNLRVVAEAVKKAKIKVLKYPAMGMSYWMGTLEPSRIERRIDELESNRREIDRRRALAR